LFGWFLQIAVLALGVAASPLPVVAVLVLLLTRRARPGSIVMLIGWILGVAVALGISMLFADTIRVPKVGADLPWEGLFMVLLGIGLVMMGVLSRRGRFRSSNPEEAPSWVSSVDNMSPLGGGIVVFLNATTSPKNLALAITAGRLLTSPARPIAETMPAVVLYVVIASLTLAVPVGLYFFGGGTSTAVLERWKRNVTAHAAAVMEITLLILGIAMTVRGLVNLLT
jgi:hypothetical protein